MRATRRQQRGQRALTDRGRSTRSSGLGLTRPGDGNLAALQSMATRSERGRSAARYQDLVDRHPSATASPAIETPVHDVALPDPVATGGKRAGSNYGPDEKIGGRTLSEFAGDVARPVGTALGNVGGGLAEAVTGVGISSTTLAGPTFTPRGGFDWGVLFNVTGGQAGWLVQEISNQWRIEDTGGVDQTPGFTPHYWEAWSVNAAGQIDPNFVDARGCDDWVNPAGAAGTEGHFSQKGKVHFTTTDPGANGLVAGAVPEAAGLLAGTAAPPGLGVARLHRYAQASWDGATDYARSAGP